MALSPHLKDLAARVSNWGRWGDGDERGTLNLIDAAAVRRAADEVRDGRALSLSIPFDAEGPQTGSIPGRTNPELRSLGANVSFTGDPADFTTSDDTFSMGVQAATHWDALAHVGYEGLLYNGIEDTVVGERGAGRLSIDRFGPIVTRGVLLDIARLRGVDHFEDNYAISGEDLDQAARAEHVTVQPGDAVLVRTGQMAFLPHDRRRYHNPSPGLSTRSIEWFHDHDVSAVATDTAVFEVWPCEDPAVLLPVHMIHLRDMGLVQGQLWYLDDLATDCATDSRWSFLLSATPLPLTGAVGGPVAPVAVK